MAASFRFIERSSLISDLCTLVLARWLLESYMIDRRLILRLTLLFGLWIQCHPGFPVGIALLAIWVVWNLIFSPQAKITDLPWLALPILVLFVNPLGPEGVFYPVKFALEQAPTFKHFNYEWFPAYHPAFRWTPEVVAFWLLSAVCLFVIAREKSWRSLRTWFALFAIAVGATAVRFVPWASFLMLMSIKPWANFKDIRLRPWVETLVRMILALVTVKNLALGYSSSSGPRHPGFEIDPAHIPTATLDFWRKNRIAGNLYNSQEFGAYLIWQGILPVFHHGFVTDMDFYRQDVMGVFQSQSRFLELAKKYDWTMLLVDKSGGGYPYFYKILSSLSDWKIVAEDDSAYLIYHLP
jgi:hypothetical protein